MSATPPPPPAVSAAATAPTADWRRSVLQSYRNAEVREISKVLAALEGSTTVTPASKLMLAMRFEDQIFKSAKDLADYRKKISKRLKKLKKNYVAPVKPPQRVGGGSGRTLSQGASGGSDNTEAKEEMTAKLKRDYGDQIRYIVTNAKAAVADLRRKLGPEKAMQLQQHTDSCRLWARDLGILTEKELDAIGPTVEEATVKSSEDAKNKANNDSKPLQSQQQSQQQPQSQPQQQPKKEEQPNPPAMSNKKAPMSLSQLSRIEKHLQTRVGNIRSYVVKHADPDQFLLETLQTKDVAFSRNTTGGNLFRDFLKGRLSSQREMYQKATAKDSINNSNRTAATGTSETQADSNNNSNDEEDPLLALQKALEKAQAGVPPPTRNDSMKLEGSLRHLDKMRAASMAMMTYWLLDGDQRLATAPRDTLKKVHEVVQDGTDFVLDAVKELEKLKKIRRRYNGSGETNNENTATSSSSDDASTKKVSLQDAWSKTIELPSAALPMTVEDEKSTNNDGSNSSNNNKRPRLNSYKPYYKTRMLFRPNRKTPQPLLAAIQRKGADLRKLDCGNTNAIHLVLDFDKAFAMTIYLSPLTVTLRAKPQGGSNDSNNNNNSTSNYARWQSLSHGLTPWGSTLDSSDFLRKKANQTIPTNNNTNDPDQQLSVWGVASGYESIGRVVEERLRDASTHATATLRKCFKNHVKDKTMDFEVELLEGSALLEFLQLARSTYMPHWEDVDV